MKTPAELRSGRVQAPTSGASRPRADEDDRAFCRGDPSDAPSDAGISGGAGDNHGAGPDAELSGAGDGGVDGCGADRGLSCVWGGGGWVCVRERAAIEGLCVCVGREYGTRSEINVHIGVSEKDKDKYRG